MRMKRKRKGERDITTNVQGNKTPFISFYRCEPWPFYRVVALLLTHQTENVFDRWKLKAKFDIQYSMSVVHYVGNVFYLYGCWETSITYWWKCFHKVLVRKCGSFNEERTMDSTHSFRLWVRGYCILCFSYLSECGVLDVVYFLPGFATTSLGINAVHVLRPRHMNTHSQSEAYTVNENSDSVKT